MKNLPKKPIALKTVNRGQRNGLVPDRYYTIFYKLNGKMHQEALGWASASWEEEKNGKKIRVNWTEKRASLTLAELQKNHSLGVAPSTLKEKRAMQASALALQKAESLTLLEFWQEDYLDTLKTRIKSSSWQKEVSHFENRIKPLIGHKPIKSITPEDIEQMVGIMRSEKLSPRTQEYAVGTFFRIWKHAAKRKLVKPELTHFTREQFFYMLSRNRSTCGVKPYIRATTNPDCDSWVREIVDWWINPNTGYAIKERSGKIRWFIMENDRIVWGNSFEREQLLMGNWNIRPTAGLFFQRSFFEKNSQCCTERRTKG